MLGPTLPGLYKIFLLCLFDPTSGFFCLDLEIWQALCKESKLIKLKAPAEEAVAHLLLFSQESNGLFLLWRF